MSKNTKKIVTIGLAFALGVTLVPAQVQGQTAEELQAQIQQLLQTIAALQAQIAGMGQTTPATPSYQFTRNLTVGSTGEDVRQLQIFLNAQGYTLSSTGAGSPGNETTYFGPRTRDAVSRFQQAHGITPTAGYFGPITRAKVHELMAASPTQPVTPGPTVPTDGVVARLASGNPASATVPKGASGVVFLEFELAGNGTVNSLTFERSNFGAVSDFTNVYLYEGNTRLTSGRTLNSTTHQVFFAGLNLSVSGVRTLRLVADIATGATAANEHRFSLVQATGTPAPSGLPQAGNVMRVGGVTVGTIEVSATSTPANPSVGQTGALLAEFELSAGSAEDVSIGRMALTHGGNLARGRITNLELRAGGQTIATASGLDGNDRITFVLSNPYLLEKGQVETFRVYGSIASDARSDDTIALYFDSAADISAVGATYGYPVTPTITGFNSSSAAATLTLQAGDVTVIFDGPVAGDIALRANDVVVHKFSITAHNNIEVRNLRVGIAITAGAAGDPEFNDVKVWDADTNSVLTSATNVTSSTGTVVFNDPINIASGQTRNFAVSVDVDASNDNGDTITVTLNNFNSTDVRNLDNNTFVDTTDIVGTPATGNLQTVATPQLDVQLSGSPSSQTLVRGAQNANLVGFAFRAIADDITVTSVKVYASSTSGTLTASEIQSLKLMDGTTQVGSTRSLSADGVAFSATFDNLSFTIDKGQTKNLVVVGNISSDATNGDVYYVYLNALGNVSARDSGNRTLGSTAITGTTANSTNNVTVSVASTGTVSSSAAPTDTENEAGIVVADGERVLSKFRFAAANEDMTVNNLRLLVNQTSSATATTTAVAKYVPQVRLYDGTTLLGTYTVQASGDNAGVVFVQNLGWVIPKDSNKTLTVKGVLSSITTDRPSGQSVYAHLQSSGFEAQGQTAKDTSITALTGNQKVIYKTQPTLSVASAGDNLRAGESAVLRFTVAADSKEQVAWKKVQVRVSMTGATMTAVDAAPGLTGNVRLRDVTLGQNVNIATAFSGATNTTGQAAITGGNTNYVSLVLDQEQIVAAGGTKTYELSLTFTDLAETGTVSSAVRLHLTEATLVNATTYANVEESLTGASSADPSFIWSDYSAANHSETTSDWANGVYVKELPSQNITTTK